MSTNFFPLPKNLPVPVDDGEVAHLTSLLLPDFDFPATDGKTVNLARLGGRWVIYVYPMTGRPGLPLPNGWDEFPVHGVARPSRAVFVIITPNSAPLMWA